MEEKTEFTPPVAVLHLVEGVEGVDADPLIQFGEGEIGQPAGKTLPEAQFALFRHGGTFAEHLPGIVAHLIAERRIFRHFLQLKFDYRRLVRRDEEGVQILGE